MAVGLRFEQNIQLNPTRRANFTHNSVQERILYTKRWACNANDHWITLV